MAQIKVQAAGLAAVMSALILSLSPAAQAADGVGMRIVRDPVTGQLRAPTADEAKAMDEAEAKARAERAAANPAGTADTRAPAEVRTSNGVRYRVNDSFLSYSVITRKADGSLAMQCVTGKDAAEKLVHDPKAAISISSVSTVSSEKEHDHADK
jgi:hypothetical protein